MDDIRVCIVIAQFGKLTSNVDLWLKSIEWNSKIDFLVCSDLSRDLLPSNVRWIIKSFPEFKELVENKLKMTVRLDTPYECCDFKAAYGIVFEDYLEGYDYWGYCDMDMIFGDLSWFFKKYNLEIYDKFQSVGHLTLMRNTKENNERFKLPCNEGKGYLDAFNTKGSTHFCESEVNQIFDAYGFPFFKERVHADIAPQFRRMRLSIKSAHPQENYKHQTFYWQNGKIWRAFLRDNGTWRSVVTEELAYIHFQKRKMAEPAFDVKTTNGYYICPDHFEEKKTFGYPTLAEIERTNPYRHGLTDFFDYIRIQFGRLIDHFHKRKNGR